MCCDGLKGRAPRETEGRDGGKVSLGLGGHLGLETSREAECRLYQARGLGLIWRLVLEFK